MMGQHKMQGIMLKSFPNTRYVYASSEHVLPNAMAKVKVISILNFNCINAAENVI